MIMSRYAENAASHLLHPSGRSNAVRASSHVIMRVCPPSPKPLTNRLVPICISQYDIRNKAALKSTWSTCDITNSGSTCTGRACSSSSNNNCEAGPITISDDPQILCFHVICNNGWSDCKADAYSITWLQIVGSCNADNECASGSCKGGNCCTEKGMSTGCTECWSSTDGDCKTCSYGYTRTDYECVADAMTTGSCTAGSQCASGSCKGGNCCTEKGMSTGCTECYSSTDGDCGTCGSGYTLTDWECVATPSSSSSDVCSTACAGTTDGCTASCPSGRVHERLAAAASDYLTSPVCQRDASACIRRHQAFTLPPRERDASACISRHQAFALPPRERAMLPHV